LVCFPFRAPSVNIAVNQDTNVVDKDAGQFKQSKPSLENQALALLVTATPATAAVQQSSAGSVLEDLANTLVGLGRALEVLESTDLLADLLTLQVNIIVSITARLTIGRVDRSKTYLLGGDGLL
jgi:hypothetical protein